MEVLYNKASITNYEKKPIKISYQDLTMIFYGKNNKLEQIFNNTLTYKRAKNILSNKSYIKDYFGKDWYEFLELEALFKKKLNNINSDSVVFEKQLNFEQTDTTTSDSFSYVNKSAYKSYNFPVMFIAEEINLDDSIETIKNKIYIKTNIIPDFQHLCYEYKNKLYPLGYKYRQGLRILNTDISDVINQESISKLIDDKMYFRYRNDKLIYDNEHKFLLKDYKNFNNEIGLFSLKKFLSNYNMSQIENLFQDSENKAKFIITFVQKYWPKLNEIKFNLFLNNEKITYLAKDLINDQYLKDQQIINYVNSLDKKDIKLDLSNSSILLIMFHINYKYSNESFLNLRGIFDFFETNEEIPFIKFSDSMTGKTIKKLYKPALKVIPKNEILKMVKGEHPKGIHFRIRITNNPKHKDYHNYMHIINLHSDGKVEFRPSWKQVKHTDFSIIKDCINVVTNFIVKINNINFEMSQRAKEIRLPNKKFNNMEITFLNINIKFNLPSKNHIDYNKLYEITKILNPYVSINKKTFDESTENSGIYMRYKRVQNYEFYINDAIKVLKEVYFFSDKRISMELMNYFNKTKEEAFKSIDEWNVVNVVKVQEEKQNVFKEYGKDIEKAIKRYTKRIGVDLKIQGPKEDGYNITVEGSNSLEQFQDIFNFVARMLHIYDNLDSILKEKNYFTLKYLENTKGKKFKSKKKEYSVKDTKKVKNLKMIDPKLFDIDPSVNPNKFKLYSKLCQGDRRQPIVYNQEEFKKINLPTDEELKKKKNYKDNYALKVKNNTYNNTVNFYVCKDHKYKYPGFLQSNKHPQNKCLVCCHTSSSINPNKPAKYSTYTNCKGSDNLDSESNINFKYVKQSGKYLKPDGLGKLNKNLDIFLNEGMTYKESKNNILENDSNYYLKYGIKQDNKTILNIMVTVFGLKNLNELYKNIEKIISNDEIFKSLENGKLKFKFNNYKNFLNYIKNDDNIINEEYTWSLLSQPNLIKAFPNGINIVIIRETIDGKLNIICPYQDNLDDFLNNKKKTLLIYKTEYYITPIFRIEIKQNKLNVIKIIEYNTKIIQKILDIYEEKCYKEKRRFESKFENVTGFKVPFSINELYNILESNKEYVIKFQNINNLNSANGLILQIKSNKRMVFIPSKPSEPHKNLKSNDKFIEYVYDDIFKFYSYLNKNTNIKIEIIKYVLDVNDKIFKLLTNYGTTIPIKKISKSKIKLNLPYEKSIFNDNEINKYIKNNEIIKDKRIDAVKEISYKEELYQLLRLEISKILDNEKNYSIRKSINKILDNEKSKDYKNTLKILDLNSENIRSIIEIASREKDINYRNQLLNDLTLKSDQKIKKSIIDILNNSDLDYEDKEKQIVKIIKLLVKDIVISSSKIPDLTNYNISNIRKTCNGFRVKSKCNSNIQCIFDKNNKCKLYIPNKEGYLDKMIVNLAQELLKNILKRNEILNNNIDLIINKDKYIERDEEILIDKEDYDINNLYK
jgi:hypothetical protein